MTQRKEARPKRPTADSLSADLVSGDTSPVTKNGIIKKQELVLKSTQSPAF